MRQKRAKQIKRLITYTGMNLKKDKKGNKLVNQYRKFKKIYTRNKGKTLISINKIEAAHKKELLRRVKEFKEENHVTTVEPAEI